MADIKDLMGDSDDYDEGEVGYLEDLIQDPETVKEEEAGPAEGTDHQGDRRHRDGAGKGPGSGSTPASGLAVMRSGSSRSVSPSRSPRRDRNPRFRCVCHFVWGGVRSGSGHGVRVTIRVWHNSHSSCVEWLCCGLMFMCCLVSYAFLPKVSGKQVL